MGLIARLSTAVVLLCASVVASAEYRIAPEPRFVVADAMPAAADAPVGKDGTRYLLASDQVDTTGARPVRYRRVSYVIESERGLAEGGRFSIAYQPDYQSVALHHIRIVRAGRVQERIGDVQVQELRREEDLESGILDGEHTLNITIPDVQVGDRIDYSFSIEGANPVFGDGFSARYTASYSDPVGLRRVRAVWTARRPLNWRVSHPGFDVESGSIGDARFVDIVGHRLSRVREEDNTPSGYDPYGRIEIGTAEAWKDVVQWALPLYVDRFADRAAARGMIESLRLHDADKLAVLARATAFAQGSVRYTALDMGENSHAPNRPETTLARRYGDCKDKAVLLVALLHEAGIRAEPVLVNTWAGSYLEKWRPSANAFDHVVVRATVDSKHYWIDATRDRELGPLATRDPLPFKLGLPVCAGCEALVPIPEPMPSQPRVSVAERIDLTDTPDGYAAAFGVITNYLGLRGADTRATFDDEGAEEMGRRYLQYMRTFYDGLEAAGLPEFAPPGASGRLRTRERYHLAWDRDEGHVFGVVLFQLLDYVPRLDAAPRRSPIALGGPRLAVQTARVSFQRNWSIAPEDEEVATRYFKLRRTVRVVDGLLEVRAEWRRLADEIPAADYAEARAQMQKARDLLEYDINLDTKPLLQSFRSIEGWMRPLVAILAALLLGGLAWYRRARSRFAGMLFRPSWTMRSILDAPAAPAWTWGLLTAMAATEALVTVLPDLLDKGPAIAWSATVFSIPVLVLRLALYAVLLRWALRAVRVQAPFDRLIASTAWGAGPVMVVSTALAIYAMNGHVEVMADDHAATPAEMPGLLVASLLLVVGSAWALASALAAHAVAARTTRRRVVGAWMIMLAVLAFLLGGLFALTRYN
jgi:transglutaminase-like putative cysteine protease